MKKRFIFIFLAAVFTVINAAGIAFAAESSAVNKAFDFLEKIGVFDSWAEYAFGAEDQVQKEQLAAALSNFSGKSVTEDSENLTGFRDVPQDHWAAGYINLCVQLGIFEGDGQGEFGLGKAVTYDQAYKTVLCAMNYQGVAAVYGGYPQGYRKLAAEIGITKNMSGQGDQSISGGDLAVLMYQALDAPVYLYIGQEGPKAVGTADKNRTPMSEYLKISKKQTGIVTANWLTSLDTEADRTEKGTIRIDGRNFWYNSSDAVNVLGLEVNYYYREEESGENTVVYLEPTKDCTETAIASGDIDAIDLQSIQYWNQAGRSKTAYFDDLLDVIYNGVVCNTVSDANIGALMPKFGNVTLIDNDGDGRIDVLKVINYQSYYVSDYNTAENILILLNPIDGTSFSLTADETDLFVIDEDGEQTDAASVKRDFVVSILKDIDQKRILGIIISNNWVSGEVRSTETSDGEIFVNGDWCKIDQDLLKSVKTGMTGTFYLTPDDVIFYAKDLKGSGADSDIYYLLHIACSEDTDPFTYTMTLMAADGTIADYELAEKTKLDGIRFENEEIINTLKSAQNTIDRYSQPLRVKLSNGKIKSINTMSADVVSPNAATYKTTTGFFYNMDKVLCYVNADTVVMYVPTVNDLGHMKKYMIGSYRDFENDKNEGAGFTAYDVDYKNGTRVADLILIKQGSGLGTFSDSYGNSGFVAKVSECLDEYEDVATYLQVIRVNGEVVELAVSGDEKFEKGDFINYSGDAKSATATVRKSRDYIMKTTAGEQRVADLQDGSRWEIGTIHEVNGNYITVGAPGADSKDCNVYLFKNTTVLEYDSKRNKLEVADRGALSASTEKVNPAARVLVYTRACELWGIVIYK